MTDILNNRAFEAVRAGVVDCLGGMDHVDRVEAMTMRFCEHYRGRVDVVSPGLQHCCMTLMIISWWG